MFADVIPGKTFDRPGVTDLLDHIRPGDTIAVVRLDRLGRSLRELLEVIETLKKRGIALHSLEEKIDRRRLPAGCVTRLRRDCSVRTSPPRRADPRRHERRARQSSKPGQPALEREKLSAALMLVKGGMSPTQAPRQTGLARSTVYREIQSHPAPDPLA